MQFNFHKTLAFVYLVQLLQYLKFLPGDFMISTIKCHDITIAGQRYKWTIFVRTNSMNQSTS
jgi:hypothetical protein